MRSTVTPRAMAQSTMKSNCKTARLPKGKKGTHRCAPRCCAAHLITGVRAKLMAALDNSEPGTPKGVKRKRRDNNNLHSTIQRILADNDDNDNDNGGDYILHQEEPDNSRPRALSRNG